MSQHSTHPNLSSLGAASSNLHHMLHHHHHHPHLHQNTKPSPPQPTSRPAHIGTASETNQTFHNEILARQIQDQYRSSHFVDQSDPDAEMRPPRYSQVVNHPLGQTRIMRDDEVLERNIQDPGPSSLVVDHPTSRTRQPTRYSQVVDERAQRHVSGRGKHDARGENLARRVQDGYNSSLVVNYSRPSPDPISRSSKPGRPAKDRTNDLRRDGTLVRQVQEGYNSSLGVNYSRPSPGSGQRVRSQNHHARRDEALGRQIHDQYNSSLAVNHAEASPHPRSQRSSRPSGQQNHPNRRDDDVLARQIQPNSTHPHHHLQPGQHTPYTILVDDDDDDGVDGGVYRWQESSRKEENRKKKKQKKPQIRAKDHEGALRWLACRRGLGGS